MVDSQKKVTIEWFNSNNQTCCVSNPFKNSLKDLSYMVSKILEEELPMLKNNSLLYDLVLYLLTEKMNTVQKVQNVLSCIKENNGKKINDVSFKNGEVYIKCSI